MVMNEHIQTAAYIDKNGDLIFEELGDKYNVLCIKDRSAINTHAVAENYRPQILCNRQCARCCITYHLPRYSGYWTIVTCGIEHRFDRLYVWRDGQYKAQADADNCVTKEEWEAELASWKIKHEDSY